MPVQNGVFNFNYVSSTSANWVQELVVKDIADNKDVYILDAEGKQRMSKWGKPMLLDYHITITGTDDQVVTVSDCFKSLTNKSVQKSLYIDEKGNTRGTQRSTLIYLFVLYKQINNVTTLAEFDINKLIGLKFSANMFDTGKDKYIDWVKTLQNAGVDITTMGGQLAPVRTGTTVITQDSMSLDDIIAGIDNQTTVKSPVGGSVSNHDNKLGLPF